MRHARHHGIGTAPRRGTAVQRLNMALFNPTGNYSVNFDDSDNMVATHMHEDFDELVFVIKGSGIHVADGDEYPLVRGDVYVLRGPRVHGFRFRHKLCLMNILYRRARFAKLIPEFAGLPGFNGLFVHEPRADGRHKFTSQLHLDARQMEELVPTINAIRYELSHPWKGNEIVAESLFKVLVARVCQFKSQAAALPMHVDERVGTVIAFIERKYAGHVSVPALARAAGMPRSTFFRVFKDVTGCSPTKYLVQLRIKRAMDVLASEDVRVIDAALRSGFDNIGYFNRAFKAVMSVTPGHYAKTHRGQPEWDSIAKP